MPEARIVTHNHGLRKETPNQHGLKREARQRESWRDPQCPQKIDIPKLRFLCFAALVPSLCQNAWVHWRFCTSQPPFGPWNRPDSLCFALASIIFSHQLQSRWNTKRSTFPPSRHAFSRYRSLPRGLTTWQGTVEGVIGAIATLANILASPLWQLPLKLRKTMVVPTGGN